MTDHTPFNLKGEEDRPQLTTEAANLAGAMGSSGVEDLNSRGSVQNEQTVDCIGLDEDIEYNLGTIEPLGGDIITQPETQSMGSLSVGFTSSG